MIRKKRIWISIKYFLYIFILFGSYTQCKRLPEPFPFLAPPHLGFAFCGGYFHVRGRCFCCRFRVSQRLAL